LCNINKSQTGYFGSENVTEGPVQRERLPDWLRLSGTLRGPPAERAFINNKAAPDQFKMQSGTAILWHSSRLHGIISFFCH